MENKNKGYETCEEEEGYGKEDRFSSTEEGVFVTKLATGRIINGSSCDVSDMVIKDLDMEPKIDAMMRDFLDPSRWKELSKETSSKIHPCGDGSCWKTFKLCSIGKTWGLLSFSRRIGGQDSTFDDDVDEPPVQDLVLNVDQVFQADQCDAFNSDVDEAPTAQTMFMENLSSADLIYD
nr:integrase, catalytic region, zinc finger, CCHC-type, peptidase aspartic, catalytic [Tanacetum cinerariifolium]